MFALLAHTQVEHVGVEVGARLERLRVHDRVRQTWPGATRERGATLDQLDHVAVGVGEACEAILVRSLDRRQRLDAMRRERGDALVEHAHVEAQLDARRAVGGQRPQRQRGIARRVLDPPR
jgi:hypothetical protein